MTERPMLIKPQRFSCRSCKSIDHYFSSLFLNGFTGGWIATFSESPGSQVHRSKKSVSVVEVEGRVKSQVFGRFLIVLCRVFL